MSEKVSSVKAIVEECLRKLVKSYEGREHIEDFLTESDVASSLFCMLKDEMKKRSVEGFKKATNLLMSLVNFHLFILGLIVVVVSHPMKNLLTS